MNRIQWDSKTKRAVKKWAFYAAVIALPLLQFLLMYVYVNINSFLLAFRQYNPNDETWKFVWFENFELLFTDKVIGRYLEYAIPNSLKAWLAKVAVGTTLALAFAYYIFRRGFGGKFFRIALFMPSIISATVLITIFKFYVDDFISEILKDFLKANLEGFPKRLFSNRNSQFDTILFFNIFVGFGTSVLMYTSAMTSLSESIFEAGKIDGVNAFQEFFLLVLPQIIGTISVFLITGLSAIFVDQLNLYAFANHQAKQYSYTVGYYLYRTIQQAGNRYQSYSIPAALGMLITVIVAPIVLLARWGLKKLDPLGGD